MQYSVKIPRNDALYGAVADSVAWDTLCSALTPLQEIDVNLANWNDGGDGILFNVASLKAKYTFTMLGNNYHYPAGTQIVMYKDGAIRTAKFRTNPVQGGGRYRHCRRNRRSLRKRKSGRRSTRRY